MAFTPSFYLVMWLLFGGDAAPELIAAAYVFGGFCVALLAYRTRTPGAWMAFVPVLDALLMLRIADLPRTILVLLLFPLFWLFWPIVVWSQIARAVRRPTWSCLFAYFGVADVLLIGWLALTEAKSIAADSAGAATPPAVSAPSSPSS